MKLLRTWGELTGALGIHDPQPPAEGLDAYDITKEIDAASYRVVRNDTVELNGYSPDSLLFTFRSSKTLGGRRFFIVECANTGATRSLEYGLFMKILLNNYVLVPFFAYHRHSRDEQFTGKGDGFFPYDVSFAGEDDPVVLHVVLWRSAVDRLRVRMYFV